MLLCLEVTVHKLHLNIDGQSNFWSGPTPGPGGQEIVVHWLGRSQHHFTQPSLAPSIITGHLSTVNTGAQQHSHTNMHLSMLRHIYSFEDMVTRLLRVYRGWNNGSKQLSSPLPSILVSDCNLILLLLLTSPVMIMPLVHQRILFSVTATDALVLLCCVSHWLLLGRNIEKCEKCGTTIKNYSGNLIWEMLWELIQGEEIMEHCNH